MTGGKRNAGWCLDAEEARLEDAAKSVPNVTHRYQALDAAHAAKQLWEAAAADARTGHLDDRPLYWARLKLLREQPSAAARARAERLSRGWDFTFPPGEPGVLLTGFDPFHLDRDIGQSNPSGVIALALHGTRIAGACVRAAILPVRFADFDRGAVEQWLTPAFSGKRGALAMAVTISMGRDRFDLERFPGRRRSAQTADNRRVRSGASRENPAAPPGLAGPEFIEFSLPAKAMSAATGRWQVRDNRRVETLERGTVTADTLADLAHCTAVAGSGGGFLSNEVAYRSLLLHARLGRQFPLGHLHTPRMTGHDPAMLADLVAQARRIIAAGVTASTGLLDKREPSRRVG